MNSFITTRLVHVNQHEPLWSVVSSLLLWCSKMLFVIYLLCCHLIISRMYWFWFTFHTHALTSQSTSSNERGCHTFPIAKGYPSSSTSWNWRDNADPYKGNGCPFAPTHKGNADAIPLPCHAQLSSRGNHSQWRRCIPWPTNNMPHQYPPFLLQMWMLILWLQFLKPILVPIPLLSKLMTLHHLQGPIHNPHYKPPINAPTSPLACFYRILCPYAISHLPPPLSFSPFILP